MRGHEFRSIALRYATYILACFGPPVSIIALSALAFGDRVAPEVALTLPTTEMPVTLFVTLSGTMITITSGLALSTVVIFRLSLRPSQAAPSTALLVVSMLLAFFAVYCGLRFQYDLAQHLRFSAPDLDPVLWRLHVQGLFLVLQVSTLSLMAARFHFHKDRRSEPN